jgi:hypothetical protein
MTIEMNKTSGTDDKSEYGRVTVKEHFSTPEYLDQKFSQYKSKGDWHENNSH